MCSPPVVLLGMPSGAEWLVILIIALLIFGNRIPGLARSLGTGINEFKSGLREGDKKPETPPAKTETQDKQG